MAAVTPTSTKQVSVGSLKGIIADFANTTDNADTWASGIPDIVYVAATQEDASSTQGKIGAGASWSGSTITFRLAEDNTAVRLLVLSGSAN